MKLTQLITVASTLVLASQAYAGDVQAGSAKATLCVACHGSASFAGMFPLVQLAGRDADKLVIKTNKYRSGKLFSPLMNMSVATADRQGCRGHLRLLPAARQARHAYARHPRRRGHPGLRQVSSPHGACGTDQRPHL